MEPEKLLQKVVRELKAVTEKIEINNELIKTLEEKIAKATEKVIDADGKVVERIIEYRKAPPGWFSKRCGELWDKIWNAINEFSVTYGREFAKYIVFLIVIMLLIGVGISASDASSSKSSGGSSSIKPEDRAKMEEAKKKNMTQWESFKARIDKLFKELSSLFKLGYRFESLFKAFSKFQEKTYDRPRYYSGRCDNVNYIQVSTDVGNPPYNGLADTDGKAGICVSSTIPNPIEWDLEKSLNNRASADIHKLPESVKNSPELDYEHKKKIYIPYATSSISHMGSFYVPQCDAAYYVNAKGEKKTVDLLENHGYVSCGLKRKDKVFVSPSEAATQRRVADRTKYCPV
jgi:hypothetical protein